MRPAPMYLHVAVLACIDRDIYITTPLLYLHHLFLMPYGFGLPFYNYSVR